MDHLDAAVLLRPRITNIAGPIGRFVIYKNDFAIFVGLIDKTAEAFIKVLFNDLLRTILSDDLFYKCLAIPSLNENFGKHMKDFLSPVVDKKFDECIASIVKNVQEDNDFLFSDETDSKE